MSLSVCLSVCVYHVQLACLSKLKYLWLVNYSSFLSSSVAAGNSKGFVVANFYVKRIITIHTTVQSDGLGSVGRVQNLRRSIRSSLRRRANTVSTPDDRQRVAASLNLEMGIEGKGGAAPRARTFSDRMGSPAAEGESVAPSQLGYVSHLTFAETHITSE